VVDNDSGIMWTRNANIDGQKDWTNAITYCSNLTYATYSDWRVANEAEWSRAHGAPNPTGFLDSFLTTTNSPALPPGHPFTNIQLDYYWSKDTQGDILAYMWLLTDGTQTDDAKTTLQYVWPCRGP